MFLRMFVIGLLANVAFVGLLASNRFVIAAPPKKDRVKVRNDSSRSGIRTHSVESEYQKDSQEIRVLLPDDYDESTTYRVLYVLPVEPGFQQRYGYGLRVFEELDVHNKYNLIVVQPGFNGSPWLGDHPIDPKIRQASHFKDVVVPWIEKRYSTTGQPAGRLLFGFSKSGWAAIGLTLRYSDFFGYAASWDAPMMFDRFYFQMERVFGTTAQLDAFRPDLLVVKNKKQFQEKSRLVLTGEMSWGRLRPAPGGGSHTVEFHKLLVQHGVKHHYDNNLRFPHRWDARWMQPTLEALLRLAAK